MSCNDTTYGQDFAPDNEIAVAVDPEDPDHIVAGSNDYFYRFNNSTGARQAIDRHRLLHVVRRRRQLDRRSDPDAHRAQRRRPRARLRPQARNVLMAQLENAAGLGGAFVSQGDVAVSRSGDGGRNWTEPVTVFQGKGTGIGPANSATFYDKEWLTVDNNPESAFYGRAYLTVTRFLNGPHGSFAREPDPARLLRRRRPDLDDAAGDLRLATRGCDFQATGPAGECDESSFSIPEVASDGTLYVHFVNNQNEAEWEVEDDFDGQIMVDQLHRRRRDVQRPVPAVQLEDGASDMPWSVIGTADRLGPSDPLERDRQHLGQPDRPAGRDASCSPTAGRRTRTRPSACFEEPREAPAYDPCDAGPSADTDVYTVRSLDGGETWGPRAGARRRRPGTPGSRGPTTSPTGRSSSPRTATCSRPEARRRSTTPSGTC